MNIVRMKALEVLGMEGDELTDAELFTQAADDEFWYVSLCLDMNRLPSEIDGVLTCREYTLLQAHSVIKKVMAGLIQTFKRN